MHPARTWSLLRQGVCCTENKHESLTPFILWRLSLCDSAQHQAHIRQGLRCASSESVRQGYTFRNLKKIHHGYKQILWLKYLGSGQSAPQYTFVGACVWPRQALSRSEFKQHAALLQVFGNMLCSKHTEHPITKHTKDVTSCSFQTDSFSECAVNHTACTASTICAKHTQWPKEH